MPSKQTHDEDVIAIEELVHEIKQNLRLKAAPPTIAASTATVQANSVQNHPLLHSPAVNNNVSSNDQCLLQQPKNITLHPPTLQIQQQHQHSHQHQLVIKKQRSRPSPYHIPCRSWNDNSTTKHRNLQKSSSCQNDENNIEDPYELLQSLLKNNSLVKEAVRRLQINNSYSRKQNNYFYYDSDESDNRSPIVMMCQLES
jgi:hypothetical protein